MLQIIYLLLTAPISRADLKLSHLSSHEICSKKEGSNNCSSVTITFLQRFLVQTVLSAQERLHFTAEMPDVI